MIHIVKQDREERTWSGEGAMCDLMQDPFITRLTHYTRPCKVFCMIVDGDTEEACTRIE